MHIMILGRNLVGSMARESSKDTLDSTKRIHELIDSIELKKVSFSKQRGNEKQKEKKKKNKDLFSKMIKQVLYFSVGHRKFLVRNGEEFGYSQGDW